MQTQQAVNKFIKNALQGDVDRYKDREESRTFSELIDQCKRKVLLPCVIFCFSKKKIENLVKELFTASLNNNQ
jgi:superfamily II RNA helicase